MNLSFWQIEQQLRKNQEIAYRSMEEEIFKEAIEGLKSRIDKTNKKDIYQIIGFLVANKNQK